MRLSIAFTSIWKVDVTGVNLIFNQFLFFHAVWKLDDIEKDSQNGFMSSEKPPAVEVYKQDW